MVSPPSYGISRRSGRNPLAVSIVASLLVVLGCSEPPQPVPEELLGVWRSTHERYLDRTFEIRPQALLFGTGEFRAASLHTILTAEEIESATNAGTRRWRLVYRDAADGTDSVEIVYREQPKRSLRFANREDWWFPQKKGKSDE